jgi:hypothetical protein
MKIGSKDSKGNVLIAANIAHRGDVYLKDLDKATRKAVLLGNMTCPECGGRQVSGYYTTGKLTKNFRGDKIFASDNSCVPQTIECPCRRDSWYWPIVWNKVGNRYPLEVLEPTNFSPTPCARQQKLIDYTRETLRVNPWASFLILGGGGNGKTVLLDAVWMKALRDLIDKAPWGIGAVSRPKLPIWRQSAEQLFDEMQSYKVMKASKDFEDPREFSVQDIAEDWFDAPRVFILEADKVNFSETKQKQFHVLLDSLYTRKEGGKGVQIVMDTNLTPNEFADESMYGERAYRRLAEMCHVLDFDSDKDPLPPIKPEGPKFEDCFV